MILTTRSVAPRSGEKATSAGHANDVAGRHKSKPNASCARLRRMPLIVILIILILLFGGGGYYMGPGVGYYGGGGLSLVLLVVVIFLLLGRGKRGL